MAVSDEGDDLQTLRRVAIIGVLLAVAGCAGAPSSASPVASTSAVPSLVVTSAAIVGVWQGVHECEGIVEALADAGFSESVVVETLVGNGLLSAIDSPDDMNDVAAACEEAIPLEHSHEFTPDGQFFSYDQDGQEVDFGTWELVDEDTLVIGAPDRPDVEFDFTIEGDHLTLEPQFPDGCLGFKCQWAIMVAMPWSGMDRIE